MQETRSCCIFLSDGRYWCVVSAPQDDAPKFTPIATASP